MKSWNIHYAETTIAKPQARRAVVKAPETDDLLHSQNQFGLGFLYLLTTSHIWRLCQPQRHYSLLSTRFS